MQQCGGSCGYCGGMVVMNEKKEEEEEEEEGRYSVVVQYWTNVWKEE